MIETDLLKLLKENKTQRNMLVITSTKLTLLEGCYPDLHMHRTSTHCKHKHMVSLNTPHKHTMQSTTDVWRLDGNVLIKGKPGKVK